MFGVLLLKWPPFIARRVERRLLSFHVLERVVWLVIHLTRDSFLISGLCSAYMIFLVSEQHRPKCGCPIRKELKFRSIGVFSEPFGVGSLRSLHQSQEVKCLNTELVMGYCQDYLGFSSRYFIELLFVRSVQFVGSPRLRYRLFDPRVTWQMTFIHKENSVFGICEFLHLFLVNEFLHEY